MPAIQTKRRSGMADEDPSAYEAVTRTMVEAVSRELREIRQRVDGLLWLGASALLIDVLMRIAGID